MADLGSWVGFRADKEDFNIEQEGKEDVVEKDKKNDKVKPGTSYRLGDDYSNIKLNTSSKGDTGSKGSVKSGKVNSNNGGNAGVNKKRGSKFEVLGGDVEVLLEDVKNAVREKPELGLFMMGKKKDVQGCLEDSDVLKQLHLDMTAANQ
ncbi:hypothetical protein ACOSQ3_013546 [Xanthoceras sorbifolium]